MNKIEEALHYYDAKSKAILNYINSTNNLSVDEIIEKGAELSELEHKMTALEIASNS